MDMVIVDCDSCEVRGSACGDCVISALLGAPDARSTLPVLSGEERRALELFAGSGMLPPLRLVRPPRTEPTGGGRPDGAEDGNSERIGACTWG